MLRTTGAVTSADGGVIGLDLGSLDGLAKGDEVQVVRGGSVIGAIKLTTIFREQGARGSSRGITVRFRRRDSRAARGAPASHA